MLLYVLLLSLLEPSNEDRALTSVRARSHFQYFILTKLIRNPNYYSEIFGRNQQSLNYWEAGLVLRWEPKALVRLFLKNSRVKWNHSYLTQQIVSNNACSYVYRLNLIVHLRSVNGAWCYLISMGGLYGWNYCSLTLGMITVWVSTYIVLKIQLCCKKYHASLQNALNRLVC